MKPDVRFTWNDGFALAYQVVGRGSEDLVYLPGYVSNVDLQWDIAPYARFLDGLASFSRLIVIDRRGVGCSDRLTPGTSATLEEMAGDVLAVLEATSSVGATIFAVEDTVFAALLLAASHPYSVRRLILFGASPSWLRSDDLPDDWSADQWESAIRTWERMTSATEEIESYVRDALPSVVEDERATRGFTTLFLNNQGLGARMAEDRMLSRVDLRDVLPNVEAPTLVLHRTEDPAIPTTHGRYVADHLPGAEYVEIPGRDALPWAGDQEPILEAIERFMGVEASTPSSDRRLATVLFTDIVGSAEHAAELGDEAWSRVLTNHHAVIRHELATHGGYEVDTAGDGFFATFDGPAQAVRCAIRSAAAVRELGLEIRAGVHTGEVETIDGKVGGIAAAIGARVCALGGPSEVLATQTAKDLTAGSGLAFVDVGEKKLKGVPDLWHLYRVVSG